MSLKEYKFALLASIIEKNETEIKKINNLLENKLDWTRIAGILLNHRLSGYFYFGMKDKYRKFIPKEMIKALDMLVLGQRCNQQELVEESKIIFNSLETTDINYAGLKGVIFGTEMYKIGARRSNDIDLLVFEKDLDKLDVIMRNLGYIQTNSPDTMIEASKREKIIQRMNYHDLVPYVKKKGDRIIEIDINFLFDGKNNLVDEQVFEMGTQIYVGEDYKFRGLAPSSFLSFLCVHFYREATEKNWVESKRNITLYKLVDIFNFIRKYSVDLEIDKLIEVFKQLNILEKCFCTFLVIQEFYDDSFINTLEKASKAECSYIMINRANDVKKSFINDLLE